MSFQVTNLKDSVAGILTGVDLDNVTDLNGCLERAVRTMSMHVDIPDSIVNHNFFMFDGVYDYLAPEYIFGGAFADIRVQGISRRYWESPVKRPIERFDRTKVYANSLQSEVSFEWDKGTPLMRIAGTRADTKLELDGMDDADSWTPTTIPALFDDTATYYHEPSSIRFNLPTSGYIEKTLTNAIDLSTYEGVGSVFLALRLPSSGFTSVELRLGSDSSNYVSVTATESFLGAWQADNWYLVQFDLANASETGTVDWDNIDYVRLTFTATGSMSNVRVGDLFISMPVAYQMLAYTPAVFKVSDTVTPTITDDTDEITLGYSAYTLYQYFSAHEVLVQIGSSASKAKKDEINSLLFDNEEGLVTHYRADNPSEELRMIDNYYSE